MALTHQEEVWAVAAIKFSINLLKLREESEVLVAKFNTNDFFNSLENADFQAGLDQIKHLTSGKTTEFVNVLKAFQKFLGAGTDESPARDDSNGRAAHLIRMLE
jgi:hypothetical protein